MQCHQAQTVVCMDCSTPFKGDDYKAHDVYVGRERGDS